MSKRKQLSLILLCWALYLTSYVAKYSYTANINPIMTFYSASKTEAGLIGTLFFFAYGAGQIVNGLLCKFYNKKYVISGAMIISAIINGIIFFQPSFFYIKYLWLVNGIAQSVLWSSLMLTLSENLDDTMINKAVFFMATTVPIGTCVAYGGSALFLRFGTEFYKYSFLLGAILATFVATLWLFSYSSLTIKKEKVERVKGASKIACGEKGKKEPLGFSFILLFVSLCVFAVVINFVKDGINTWFPTILKENFEFNDSLSVLLTFVLPIFGVFGSTLALALNKKIKDFVLLSGVFFLTIALIVLLVLWLFNLKATLLICIVVLVAFGAISTVMYAQNNVITSIAPFNFRKKMNSGMVSGLLNGFCYIGSTLASYLLGFIADNSGWNTVFILLFTISAFPFVYSVIYFIVKKIKENKILY